MTTKPTNQSPVQARNSVDIAREVFRQLAVLRIPPTPEAYEKIYHQIAGLVESDSPGQKNSQKQSVANTEANLEAIVLLRHFAATLSTSSQSEMTDLGQRLGRALERDDWQGYRHAFTQLLLDKHGKNAATPAPIAPNAPMPVSSDKQMLLLRELFTRAMTFGISSLLKDVPAMAAESAALGEAIKAAYNDAALNDITKRLKQLCFQIELRADDNDEKQKLLFRLFQLLLDNVSDLLEDDSWLQGQISVFKELIAGPLDQRVLEEATRSLKEVIYKQGLLKHSLSEAKVTMKNMMATFVDRIGHLAASTGDYHQKIGSYSQKISTAQNIDELNHILAEVMHETSIVQSAAVQSHSEMLAARQEVQEAENRIMQLEAKLQHMSELVREDQLTGSLNRRGLDDVFEREVARADRRGTPLCLAMLDLDNFKRLNDSLGHLAGDEALVHLVRVVKQTLRSMDVIARFGGEEFLILLPETPIDEAILTLTRVQRALTKHFFMHNNERILITFSAGVALRAANEDQNALVSRADKALLKAKQAGKNRVFAAS
jgi:diguanylate cyclase